MVCTYGDDSGNGFSEVGIDRRASSRFQSLKGTRDIQVEATDIVGHG